MKRSNLKNIANKSGKVEDKKCYKIQWNVVTKLNKKVKKLILKKNFRKEKIKRIFGISVNLTLLTRVSVTMKT